ncbi:hypothetical protein JIN84_09335 [Luteolibacter yonseiensis]|uniref:Uncharacterized protein n=1 Tax=Luteolibacter yonseiensis TaxID=1144680 RepID=A0A934R2T6_9BACT|nr:hypothetical protein [Luteolibacter yonseiensis]MBK1815819.1 hypothetical protein [Luteolibacter yonseiensis]
MLALLVRVTVAGVFGLFAMCGGVTMGGITVRCFAVSGLAMRCFSVRVPMGRLAVAVATGAVVLMKLLGAVRTLEIMAFAGNGKNGSGHE